jgi:hypothetical protein
MLFYCCDVGDTMSLWNWATNGSTVNPPDGMSANAEHW